MFPCLGTGSFSLVATKGGWGWVGVVILLLPRDSKFRSKPQTYHNTGWTLISEAPGTVPCFLGSGFRCSSSHRVESKVPMSCRFAGGFCWQRRCRDSPARERVKPSPAAAEYASREGGYVQRTRGGERKHTCFVARSGEVGGLDAARNGNVGGIIPASLRGLGVGAGRLW